MAKQVVEYLRSDLSGEEISADSKGGTVEFAVSGASYLIDLTDGELDEFNQALAPYVDVAQRLSSRGARVNRTTVASSSGRRSKEQLIAIRSWAKKNGYTVSERGRVPEAVLNAFDAAH